MTAADIIIGDGMGTDYNPFYMGYDYAYEVNLYKSSEIGSSFTVQRLERYCDGGSGLIKLANSADDTAGFYYYNSGS